MLVNREIEVGTGARGWGVGGGGGTHWQATGPGVWTRTARET